MGAGFKIADGFIEVHADTSELRREIMTGAKLAGLAAGAAISASLASSLGVAASAAVAAAPAMLGLGAAVGAVTLAFKDATNQTRAAVAWNNELKRMAGSVEKLRKTAQTAILPGFTSMLADARKLIPEVNGYIRDMGQWIGAAAKRMGDFVESRSFRDQLRNIMRENTKAAENFANSIVPIGSAFMTVSEAAAPLVSRFTNALEIGAQIVSDWLDMKRQSGELARFFQLAGDEMAKWWTIGKNVVTGVLNLFREAAPAGRTFSTNLVTISSEFAKWTASEGVRDRLQSFFGFFANMDYQKLLGIAGAVGAIATAFKGFSIAQAGVGAIAALAGLGPVGLAIGGVALAVGALVAAFGYLYTTNQQVRDSAREVWTAIKDQLGPVFERFRAFIADNIVPVLKTGLVATLKEVKNFFVDTLLPAIREMYDNYLPKLEKAWRTITNAFKDNEGQLSTLANWFKVAGTWVVEHLLPALGTVAGFLIGVFAGAVSGVIKTIGWFVDTVHAIGAAFTWVKETAITVWNAVTNFLDGVFSWIGSAVGTVRDAVVGAFQWVWDKITTIWNGITGAIGFAFDIIKQIFAIAWDWVDRLTGGKLTAIKETVGSVINTVKDTINNVLETVKSIWKAAWEWVSTKVSDTWGGIKTATTTAVEGVKKTISDTTDKIKGFFSDMWKGVKDGWNTGWTWLKEKADGFVKGLKDTVGGIKDKFVDTIKGIPRGIVGGLNAALDLVDKVIKKVNGFLPGNPIPLLNANITVPQGYATGGRITGPGTGTSDSIPIMASNGEYMLRAGAVAALQRAYGAGFLDRLNHYDISGDPSATVVRGYANGGLISRTQAAIRGADPLPYVWGAVGPGAYDCSGLVGQVWAMLTGHPSFRRYFTTANIVPVGGFRPGHGTFTIGLSDSHVVGNLAGLAFEAASSRSGIKVGGAAKSVDAMPRQYYLPEIGGQFIGGGSGADGPSFSDLIKKAINEAAEPLRRLLPKPGGFMNPLVTGLFDKAIGGLKAMSFDSGGALPTGPSLVYNGTGRNEQVLTPQQIDRLAGVADRAGIVINKLEVNVKGVLDPADPASFRRLAAQVDEAITNYRREYA